MFFQQATGNLARRRVGKKKKSSFNPNSWRTVSLSSLCNWVLCSASRCVFWGTNLSAERAGSTLQRKKRHRCHPICFHWQKRLQQEKHECWFFSMCIPDLWKRSLFSHSLAERLAAAGNACLFNRLSLRSAPPAKVLLLFSRHCLPTGSEASLRHDYFWILYRLRHTAVSLNAGPLLLILQRLHYEACSFWKQDLKKIFKQIFSQKIFFNMRNSELRNMS